MAFFFSFSPFPGAWEVFSTLYIFCTLCNCFSKILYTQTFFPMGHDGAKKCFHRSCLGKKKGRTIFTSIVTGFKISRYLMIPQDAKVQRVCFFLILLMYQWSVQNKNLMCHQTDDVIYKQRKEINEASNYQRLLIENSPIIVFLDTSKLFFQSAVEWHGHFLRFTSLPFWQNVAE